MSPFDSPTSPCHFFIRHLTLPKMARLVSCLPERRAPAPLPPDLVSQRDIRDVRSGPSFYVPFFGEPVRDPEVVAADSLAQHFEPNVEPHHHWLLDIPWSEIVKVACSSS